jgi:hypothetical protein
VETFTKGIKTAAEVIMKDLRGRSADLQLGQGHGGIADILDRIREAVEEDNR